MEAVGRWRHSEAEREPFRSRWRSLRLHILVWALPALAILLLAVLIVDIFAYQWVMVFVGEQRAHEIAETSAMRMAGQMQEQARRLVSVANSSSIRFGDTTSRSTALAEAVAATPQLLGDGVSFLSRQGMVVASHPRRPALQARDLRNSPHFQALLSGDQVFFSDVVQEEGDSRPMVVIAVPVQGLDGQFGGALVTRFYLDGAMLAAKVPSLGTDDPGHIYVLDRTGRVIYHPERRLLNQQLPADSPLTKTVMQGDSGSRLVAPPYGDPQIVGYAAVPEIGWRLVVQEPWEATIAPLRTYVWLGSGALLGGVILSITAILWGARRISIPVDDLVQQAEAAVQSDYRTRVRSESISELQRLAASFNRMIEQIETYRAGLRRYVAAITNSQEEERRRIARELHDDTIQSLVAINRRLELLKALLGDRPEAEQQLKELRALVQESIEGVRRFSRELRPTLLEDLGLAPALRQLVKELLAQGIEATLSVHGDSSELDPAVELALYRIVQEALNNVHRHAQAYHVQVGLDIASDLVHLSVEDDGRGFEMTGSLNELAQRGSFGLMGIQERVELLGGHMAIHSRIGQGTRLDVWLPRSAELAEVVAVPHRA
jgi:signal transduction histidine kinase